MYSLSGAPTIYTAGVSLVFPHGLGLSFFSLHLSCSRNRTVAERTQGSSLAKLTCMWSERQAVWPRTFQAAASQSICLAYKRKGGGEWERPTPCTSALAAGQPYPSHSEHCLKSWSSQGPCGPALLARHACLFMGTFSSPCGLSRVTWQAKETGDKCYLWLASETFLP